MIHICTKMKQKGVATAKKWLNFQNLIQVVHFSIKLILIQLYLIQTKNYFNKLKFDFLEYVELIYCIFGKDFTYFWDGHSLPFPC